MEFLTAKDVAKIIKCSEWFVYQNRQLFGGIKIGKVVRFEKQTIEEILYERNKMSKEMAIRLLDERREASQKRISHQASGQNGRNRSKKEHCSDDF